MDARTRGLRGLRGLHGRASRRSSRSSTRRRSTCPALRGAAGTPREADPPLAESITGELIASEIEIRSGKGATFADAVAQQHDARDAPVPARRRARRAPGGHRHASLEPVAGAADHRHRALPPPRGGAQVRRVAQQHVLAPRSRGRARRRPRDRRLRPPARGAARPAGAVGELAVPRRARLGPALGADADLHQELPALRRAPSRSGTGPPTPTSSTSWSRRTRSSSTRSSGGASGRTTTSAPSSSGSATPRRAPRTRPRWPG